VKACQVWPDQEAYMIANGLSHGAFLRAAIDAFRGEASPYESQPGRDSPAVRAGQLGAIRLKATQYADTEKREADLHDLRAAFHDRAEADPGWSRAAKVAWLGERRLQFKSLRHVDPFDLLGEMGARP